MPREQDIVRIGVAWRELRRVAAMGGLKHRLHATSVGLVEQAQVDALAVLVESSGLRMSELADQLRVDASTATRAAQRLVDSGLAERVPDPCDRRGVVVVPTDLGRRIRGELGTNARAVLHDLLDGFDDGELHEFAGQLERFIAAVEAMAAEPAR